MIIVSINPIDLAEMASLIGIVAGLVRIGYYSLKVRDYFKSKDEKENR